MDSLTKAAKFIGTANKPVNPFKKLACVPVILLLTACGGSNLTNNEDSIKDESLELIESDVSFSNNNFPASNSDGSSSSNDSTYDGGLTESETIPEIEPYDIPSDPVVEEPAPNIEPTEPYEPQLPTDPSPTELPPVDQPPGSQDPIDDTIELEQPGVRLVYPDGGSQYEEGATIEVGANAWDTDGTVTKVNFYANNSWIGQSTSRPFKIVWQKPGLGEHKLHVVAHDDSDLTTKSGVRSVSVAKIETNTPPEVTLVSPNDLSEFLHGTTIKLASDASDDQAVTKVDFYQNGEKIGTDFASPYEFDWTAPAVGSYDIHAIAIDSRGEESISSTHRITINAIPSDNSLAVYPVPAAISNQHKSNRFSVSVSQQGVAQNSFVYKEDNKGNPTWNGNFEYMQTANHWTTFSFSGEVKVVASRLDGANIKSCVIRPKVLKIQPVVLGNKCTFILKKPVKVSVEIDETNEVTQHINKIGTITKHIVKHPLFVFADPMETDIPSANDPNVIYFGPGLHHIGKGYAIPDNTTVYIAGGAYVIGNFISAKRHPKNVQIRGRGILSGRGLSENQSENFEWANHAIDFTKGSIGKGNLIEGITITDPLRSCIVSYNQTDVRNVKLFSWRHRNDGIGVGNNSIIEDSFLKVQDDNIKLYFSNQIIRNNVIWQQTSGAVFKFAWELKRVAQNNSVYNIDVIHSNVFFDYPVTEPDRPDLNSTSAIFSAMGFNKNAAFKNNTFQWIRIEEENLLRLMSLRMVSTHKTEFAKSIWGNPNESASKLINNIMIEDLSIGGIPYKASTLYGNNGGVISKLWFSNLKINGQPISSKGQLTSKLDGVGLIATGNVSNIIIKH